MVVYSCISNADGSAEPDSGGNMKFILIILMLLLIPVISVQASELTAPTVTGEAASRMPEETGDFGRCYCGQWI